MGMLEPKQATSTNKENTFGEGKQESQKQNRSNMYILTNPYQLATRTAVFREKYKEHIGYTVQSNQPSDVRLGVNALEVYKTIEFMGFNKLMEDMAEHLVPDDEKLSLLLMASGSNAVLSGTSYLTLSTATDLNILCNKWLLVESLRQTEERMAQASMSFLTGSGSSFGHEYFLPFTLNLQEENLESVLETRPGSYVVRLARAGAADDHWQERLVHIRAGHVREDLQSIRPAGQLTEPWPTQLVLQELPSQPLLVDKRQFSVQVYLLLVNTRRAPDRDGRPRHSGYFAFLHPGFVRLGSAPYDPSDWAGAARAARDPQLKEATTWYPDELNLYLNKRRRATQQDWARDILYPRVGAALGYLASVFRSRLDDRDSVTNAFRVLGANFLVDENLRLLLQEVVEPPCCARDTAVLGCVKPNLWREAVCLASETAIRYKSYRTVTDDSLTSRQNFRMVYSSEDPWLARRNVTQVFD